MKTAESSVIHFTTSIPDLKPKREDMLGIGDYFSKYSVMSDRLVDRFL